MSRPIRILYDEWGFQETHGGVSRLFSEVMKNLPEGFEWILPQTSTVNEYLKEPPFNLPPAKLIFGDFIKEKCRGRYFPGAFHVYKLLANLFPKKFPAYEVNSLKSRRRAVAKGDYDIYHCGALDWKGLPEGRPMVATVCDLIPEIISKDQMMKNYRRRILTAASHIIAITEYTKHDVMEMYGIPSQKITVIYLGYNMGVSGLMEKSDVWKDPYVVFIGKRAGYKNFKWMVRALAPYLRGEAHGMENGRKLRLFCTGTPFTSDEQALFRELRVEGQITQKFVTDGEMRKALHGAICFIHPSLYEGFGIPILDAFAAECPVLLANASCFPEVGGDAALYFNPSDMEDFQNKLDRLLDPSNIGFRNQLVIKGKERVKSFSWKRCAEETASVYQMVYDRYLGGKLT